MRIRSSCLALLLVLALAGCASPEPSAPASLPGAPEDAEEPSVAGPEAPPAAEPEGPTEPRAAVAWPALDKARIRPGVALYRMGAENSYATSNFLFSDAFNATLYLGTAGHAVNGMAIGDPVGIGGTELVGHVAYCSWIEADGEGCMSTEEATEAGAFEHDFALIALPDPIRSFAHPAVLGWGGPTGLADAADVVGGAPALTFGNTTARDADTDLDPIGAREGWVIERDAWTTYVEIVPTSFFGDSGAAFMLGDGAAFGVLSGVYPRAGTHGVANLDVALEAASAFLGTRLEIKTWELLREPILPELPGVDASAGKAPEGRFARPRSF